MTEAWVRTLRHFFFFVFYKSLLYVLTKSTNKE